MSNAGYHCGKSTRQFNVTISLKLQILVTEQAGSATQALVAAFQAYFMGCMASRKNTHRISQKRGSKEGIK